MKFYILTLLFIIILNIVNCGEFYGASYMKSPSTYSQAGAVNFCLSQNVNGVKGYLATIGSENELDFLITDGIITATNFKYWISGSDKNGVGKWLYNSGPSLNNDYYNIYFDKCETYCPFSPTEPNFIPNQNGLHLDYDTVLKKYMYTNADSDSLINALCKFTPNSSYVGPVKSSGLVTITNAYFNFSNPVVVTFSAFDGGSNTFPCTDIKQVTQTMFTCAIPYPGTGKYKVTIQEGAKTDIFQPWQYPAPFVSTLNVPSTFATGNLVTIIGSNFGNNASQIQVSFTPTQSVLCNTITFLTPPNGFNFQMITCNLVANIPTNQSVLPIVIVVNTVKTISHRTPFLYNSVYYSAFPELGNLAAINSFVSQIKVDGQNGRLGLVTDLPMYTYFLRMLPPRSLEYFAKWSTYLPLTYKTSSYYYNNGPKNGQVVVPYSQTPLVGPTASMTFAFSFSTASMTSIDPTAQSGALLCYGGIPPTFKTNSTIIIPTSGGIAELELDNFGTIFSIISIQFRSNVLTFSKDYIESDLDTTIPIGYGGPYAISVTVDGSTTPTSTQFIDYGYPLISNADISPTVGSNITVTGSNFYNDATLLTVNLGTVICTNVQIILAHTQLVCTLPSGTGTNNLTITLSGRVSNPYSYSYQSPTIDNVNTLPPLGGTLVLKGSNFGTSINNIQISSSLTGTNLTCTLTIVHTQLTCTLSPNQGNSTIIVTVSSLPSNSYIFSYDSPIVNNIKQIEDYLIFTGENFGNNFNQLQVSIGSVSLNTACLGNTTYVICKPVPWNAESNDVTITGSAHDPSPIPFYFTPYLSSLSSNLVNTTGEEVTIGGRYFEISSFNQPEQLVVIDNGVINNNTGYSSNFQLQYTILPGTGTNKLLQVRAGTNRTSNAITFSFNKPLITTVSYGLNNMVIVDGYNFGNDLSKLTISIGSFKGKSVVLLNPHYQIEFLPIPQSINGDLIINVNSQIDTYSPIKIKPNIQSCALPPIQGSQVDLVGDFLFTADQNGENTNIQFYFNNVLSNCQYKLFNTSNYIYNCTIQQGTGKIQSYIVNDGIQSDLFNFTYQPPTVTDISSVVYNIGGLVTITGTNFASTGLQISIGETTCTSPQVINSTCIVCQYSGKDDPYSSPLAVNVTVDSLFSSNNIFTYFGLEIDQVLQINETLIIQGDNIGPVQDLQIHLSNINIGSLCQGNKTQITCGPLPLNMVSGTLIIDDGATIPVPNYVVTLNPWISFISQDLFETEGEIITISGRFFETVTMGTNNTILIVDKGVANSNFNFTSNSTISYQIPYGTGKNYTLAVQVSDRLSNEIEYSYNPPSFISYTQIIDYLTIVGDNFGQIQSDISILYQNYQNPLLTQSITNDKIILRLPGNITNGYFQIKVSNQITENIKLLLLPVIYKVSPNPLTTGSKVTITGGYMSTLDSDGNKVDVKFNSSSTLLNCTYLTTTSPYQIECNQPVGYGYIEYFTFYPVQIDSNDSVIVSDPFNYQYQSPIIQSATSIFYQEMKDVTISGQSFTSTNFTIQIGGAECSKPVYINENYISCFFDGSIPPPPLGRSLSVSVNACGLVGSNNVFMYYYQKTCPGSCSGMGVCNPVNGLCKCNQGQTSFDCSIAIDDETPTTPQPTHDTYAISTIPTGYPTNSFDVLVSHLREVKPTGSVEKLYGISNFTWVERTSISQTSTYYKATYKLVVLEITITYYPSFTTESFASDPMEMQSNSLKYLVKVSNWTFASQNNYLQVIFDNKAIKTELFGCDNSNNVTTTSRYGGGDQTTWYQIITGSADFNTLFSDRVYLDKNVISNQLIILDPSDQLYTDVSQTNLYHLLAAVQVPYFKTSTTIDPNFSSASRSPLDNSCDESNIKSDKKETWKLAVGLSVGLFGLLLIVILTIIIVKKKLAHKTTKLRTLNNNNNIDRQ